MHGSCGYPSSSANPDSSSCVARFQKQVAGLVAVKAHGAACYDGRGGRSKTTIFGRGGWPSHIASRLSCTTWRRRLHANRFNPRGDRSAAAGLASGDDMARPGSNGAWSAFQIVRATSGTLIEVDEERRHFPGPQDCSSTRRLTVCAGVDQHLAVV